MEYFIAAGMCAVPLLVLCLTGKVYFWRFLKLKGVRWSESPGAFLAYLSLYVFFIVFFCWKGIQGLPVG